MDKELITETKAGTQIFQVMVCPVCAQSCLQDGPGLFLMSLLSLTGFYRPKQTMKQRIQFKQNRNWLLVRGT